ncbi:hypothetical protein D5086_003168 [Populus alba]|uniref:Uncharacterized protein n=1 Tax=Populus alba TaxID=43335 RepID=A0ACC4D401_POPAL
MKSCLKRFCSASSQEVSKSKPQIFFSKNARMRVRQKIYAVFELQRMDDLNIGEKFIIEKVQQRFAGWKAKGVLVLEGVTTRSNDSVLWKSIVVVSDKLKSEIHCRFALLLYSHMTSISTCFQITQRILLLQRDMGFCYCQANCLNNGNKAEPPKLAIELSQLILSSMGRKHLLTRMKISGGYAANLGKLLEKGHKQD